MPSINGALDQSLYDIAISHLTKIGEYLPGPFKKAGGTKALLVERYRQDPLFSIFGLDSPEYVGAAASGGTITSIHRKIGDIYEASVKTIFMHTLNQTPEQVIYSTIMQSGDKEENRSADCYLQFDSLPKAARRRIETYCRNELLQLTPNPKVTLIGVGMEVRHCYQTGDSKRAQADEAMARHFYVSGILPIMPLFCNQSNPGIIKRYRTVWVIKQGMESYNLVKRFSGYDFYDFLVRNRDDFRAPVLTMLRTLTA
jgi:hypothetical protein